MTEIKVLSRAGVYVRRRTDDLAHRPIKHVSNESRAQKSLGGDSEMWRVIAHGMVFYNQSSAG